ncbi:MAG: Hsp20/alpha crystallin family protein [Fuerstiella sp.]
MSTHTKPRFSLFDELDRGLNHLVNEVLQQDGRRTLSPPLSVVEFEDRYVVSCDLPGVVLEDIELSLEEGVLLIRGSRSEVSSEDAKVTVNERRFGSFERRLQLGRDVDAESVSAELGDGVLSVTIRKQQQVRPQKISIRKAGDPEQG